MITIDLGTVEYYNDEENQFVNDEGGIVRFEYSLKMLYDWEGKWKKPFLKGGLTDEETIDFYKMMALDPIEERFITTEVMDVLADYIKDDRTATTFTSNQDDQNGNISPSRGKVHTSEEIYAIMISNNIPMEFEYRNLNRLMTIIRVIATHNNPPKKMSKQDILKQNAKLNAERRAKLNSKG